MNKQTVSISEVLSQVAADEVETVRIVFVDQHGITRGKTIMANALASAFDKGIAMTSTLLLKDTSHKTVFPIWEADTGFGEGVMSGGSDFLMKPDPATFKILPWTAQNEGPKSGWLLSDICQVNGGEIELSTRQILRHANDKLNAMGMNFVCGLEVEFYVLKIEDTQLGHSEGAQPRTSLLARGNQYLTENRVDALDEVMELLRVNAAALGLPLRSMESEFGPSQFEFTFEPMGPIVAADMMVLFRNMVKQVCARHGYHATFMCRPYFKQSMGSGWHLHQSIEDIKSGKNLFIPDDNDSLTQTASSWIGGLLEHARSSCILSTPTINGYKRYQPYALAPDRVQWGHDNRGAMLRYLGSPGDSASRIENRVGEPAANPYLYIASQILSGIAGIKNKSIAPQPVERPYQGNSDKLPENLGEAINEFSRSDFYRAELGETFVDYFVHIKRAEWQRYLSEVSRWEHNEYFSNF